MVDSMTYVEQQTPAELRAHMTRLKKMPGWHEPLADRLFREVQDQDAEIARLTAEGERVEALLNTAPVLTDEQRTQLSPGGFASILPPAQIFELGWKTALGHVRRLHQQQRDESK